jgi:hypothetical protein
MCSKRAASQPEVIASMKPVLEVTAMMVPEGRRTSAMQAQIASHILACAVKGERDPIALRTAALSAIVDSTHYSHDVSSERRVV